MDQHPVAGLGQIGGPLNGFEGAAFASVVFIGGGEGCAVYMEGAGGGGVLFPEGEGIAVRQQGGQVLFHDGCFLSKKGRSGWERP